MAATLLRPPPLPGQVLYGSLVGNVKDPSGAAVPGASVTITNFETNLSRETLTGTIGSYAFPTVRTGTYIVKVSLPGFKEFVKTDVLVTLNNITRIDVKLEVGTITETVRVSGITPLLQSDRAEVRTEMTVEKLENLPVPLGRNYQHLFVTIPGFSPPREMHSIQTNPSRSLVFNVNGVSHSINNTRIDGASSINPFLPHITAYVPALESIQTVNVVTNSFDAEQGLAGGAAISVQLKSGTNQYHGSMFFTHHDHHLRARNFFYPTDQDKGKFIFNQWGATLGGPIKKDRLFLFASYEGTADGRNASQIVSVPTEARRQGIFTGGGAVVYDPLTGKADGTGRLPFPNNVIPSSRIDPIVQKILSRLPLPNLAGPDGLFSEANNYFATGASWFNRWTIDSKVDWNASPNLNMFGRLSVLDYENLQPTVFGRGLVGGSLTTFGGGAANGGSGFGNSYNFSYGFNYIPSSTFLLDGHFGFARFITDSRTPNYGQNIGLDFLGIPGTNGPAEWQGDWPVFSATGYETMGVREPFMPYYRKDDQYQYVANFTWSRGKHELRWGFDFNNQHMNHLQPEGGTFMGARGHFRFGSGPTRLCTRPDGKGGCRRLSPSVAHVNNWASFLLGLPSTRGKNFLTVTPFTTRYRAYSLYFRNRWQISRKLTFSIGTRWEYFPMPTRADRGLERYDPETNRMLVGGTGSVPQDLGVRVSKKMFAPRAGLAYRLTDTFVIRAGYGLTNDPFALTIPLRTNHPVFIELRDDAVNSHLPVGKISDGIPPIPIPDLGDGIIEIPPNVFGVAVPTQFQRGYVQSWNLTLQKELRWKLVGEVGYVASRQIRQLGRININYSDVGGGNNGRQLFKKFGRTAETLLVSPIGGTHYDSMQARLQRRFSEGFSLDVAYTWGKSITNSGESNSQGRMDISIPAYYHLNRRVSDFDRTHSFHISNIWQLPFGPGRRWLNRGGILGRIAGGWQANSIASFISGTPFSVTASAASLNAPGNNNIQRADLIKSHVEIYGGVGPGQPYFDPTAFAPVNEARFGTAGFNILRGPGIAKWDFGLFRKFRVNERVNIEFRMESFNFTNTPQFDHPGANVSNLRLNPDGSIRDLNGFTEITMAGGERQFRFGLRIAF